MIKEQKQNKNNISNYLEKFSVKFKGKCVVFLLTVYCTISRPEHKAALNILN